MCKLCRKDDVAMACKLQRCCTSSHPPAGQVTSGGSPSHVHLLNDHSWPQMEGSRIPWHSLLPVPEQPHFFLCALNGVGSAQAAMANTSCPYHQAYAP